MKQNLHQCVFVLTLFLYSFSICKASNYVIRHSCANVTLKSNLNLSMLTGEWYEILHTPNRWEDGACTQITQNLTPDRVGLHMRWEEITSNKAQQSYKYAISIGEPPSDGPAAKLSIRFTKPAQAYSLPFHVVDTDYTNYLLIYSCYPIPFFNLPNVVIYTENAWILSRRRVLNSVQQNVLKNLLESSNVRANWMESVNQNNCSKLYSKMADRSLA